MGNWMILLVCTGIILKKYVNMPVSTVNGLATAAVWPGFVAKLRAVSASCQKKNRPLN
jgi:mannitol-1-phosphate/altronate dehydrogenase